VDICARPSATWVCTGNELYSSSSFKNMKLKITVVPKRKKERDFPTHGEKRVFFFFLGGGRGAVYEQKERPPW